MQKSGRIFEHQLHIQIIKQLGENMKLKKYRKTYCLLAILFFLIPDSFLSAVSNFTGNAGVKGDLTSNQDSNDYDPQLTLQSFFAGQFDFTSNITIRTEFSMQTADIIDNGIFEDTDAKFKIDELSLTKQFTVGGLLNYFSIFAGTYEPIGSDIFLRRHFGIEPIDSMLTQSWLGLKGSTVHPFYGIGGSFIVHYGAEPVATGLYIYVNHQNTDKYELNTDFRIACAFDNFCLDFAAGSGEPLNSENSSGEKVFLVIDKLYMHSGIEMMIGNRYGNSLFAEGGFQDMLITRDINDFNFSADNIYLLIEPRFSGRTMKVTMSLFSFPKETVENLFFIDDTFGFDLAIYTDAIQWRTTTITVGFHTTLSYPEKNIADFESVLQNNYKDGNEPNIKLSPFLTIPFLSGSLQTMLQATVSDFNDVWEKAIVLNIGYRTNL